MASRRALRRMLLGAAAAALVAIQVAAPQPGHSLLWAAVFDAGHAPLYGLVALMLLALLRANGREVGGSRIATYVVALGLTTLAGTLAEMIQRYGSGDAEFGDLARDSLGATSFLLAAYAFDPERGRGRLHLPRSAILFAAALPLAVAFVPLGGTAAALLRRDAAFPTICDFSASWESRFVVTREADLEKVPPPAGWGRGTAERVARLTFHSGIYPGLSIRALHPNWTGYRELVFETYSELPQPVALVFSIHDIGHDTEYDDRFNRQITIGPGASRISIPLRDMQAAPRGRQMDLSRMCGLVLYADHLREPFALYLDAFRLE